jgi:hypothetical protein
MVSINHLRAASNRWSPHHGHRLSQISKPQSSYRPFVGSRPRPLGAKLKKVEHSLRLNHEGISWIFVEMNDDISSFELKLRNHDVRKPGCLGAEAQRISGTLSLYDSAAEVDERMWNKAESMRISASLGKRWMKYLLPSN